MTFGNAPLARNRRGLASPIRRCRLVARSRRGATPRPLPLPVPALGFVTGREGATSIHCVGKGYHRYLLVFVCCPVHTSHESRSLAPRLPLQSPRDTLSYVAANHEQAEQGPRLVHKLAISVSIGDVHRSARESDKGSASTSSIGKTSNTHVRGSITSGLQTKQKPKFVHAKHYIRCVTCSAIGLELLLSQGLCLRSLVRV